jgi:hypothetical protein
VAFFSSALVSDEVKARLELASTHRPACHTAFLGACLDDEGTDFMFSGKLMKTRQE